MTSLIQYAFKESAHTRKLETFPIKLMLEVINRSQYTIRNEIFIAFKEKKKVLIHTIMEAIES